MINQQVECNVIYLGNIRMSTPFQSFQALSTEIQFIILSTQNFMKDKPDVLKIACWNTRGYNSAVPYLRKLCENNDILAVSEHWLHENKLKFFEEVSDKFSYCARSSKFATAENYGIKRGQGGVALLWSKDLGGVSQINDIIHDRMCGIRIQTRNNLIINVISIYLPAQGCPESFPAVLDDLSEFVSSRELGSKTIICGDANADIGFLGGPRSKKKPTQRGVLFYEFLKRFNLTPVNLHSKCKGPVNTFTGPTGSSTIDYLTVPTEIADQVIDCNVLSEDVLNCSDHLPVVMSIDVGTLLPTTVKGKQVKIPKWNKVSSDILKSTYTDVVEKDMQDILTFSGKITTPREIDIAIDRIVRTLSKAGKAIPTSCYRPNLKPYWNAELKKLKDLKVAKFRCWVTNGRPRGPESVLWKEHKNPAGKCTYNVRTMYVQARTYGFGTDNIRNESFLDVRVRTYNVRT